MIDPDAQSDPQSVGIGMIGFQVTVTADRIFRVSFRFFLKSLRTGAILPSAKKDRAEPEAATLREIFKNRTCCLSRCSRRSGLEGAESRSLSTCRSQSGCDVRVGQPSHIRRHKVAHRYRCEHILVRMDSGPPQSFPPHMGECYVFDELSRAETAATGNQRSCRRRCRDHRGRQDQLALARSTVVAEWAVEQP